MLHFEGPASAGFFYRPDHGASFARIADSAPLCAILELAAATSRQLKSTRLFGAFLCLREVGPLPPSYGKGLASPTGFEPVLPP